MERSTVNSIILPYNSNLRFTKAFNINTRIYNLSSGPHITLFSAVVVKKRKYFQ